MSCTATVYNKDLIHHTVFVFLLRHSNFRFQPGKFPRHKKQKFFSLLFSLKLKVIHSYNRSCDHHLHKTPYSCNMFKHSLLKHYLKEQQPIFELMPLTEIAPSSKNVVFARVYTLVIPNCIFKAHSLPFVLKLGITTLQDTPKK